MEIAIPGWGYLIRDRRGLDVSPDWQPDGPWLPIEFARFADPPRILPARVEGAPVQPTFWTPSQKRSMLAAAADLAVREGVGTHEIGQWSREESMRKPVGVEAVIAAWAEAKGLDGAVWREFGWGRPPAAEPDPDGLGYDVTLGGSPLDGIAAA